MTRYKQIKSAITIGDYTAVHARSLTTGEEWWRVYFKQAYDPLSDHETLSEAKAAIKRYQAGDARRKSA
jgi:hypothetical protein